MPDYKVVEKFVSINGEGVLAGQLAVFIRLKGCNLACDYCDTSWANKYDATYQLINENQIYRYIKETGVKNVTLTGGEPLMNPDIWVLLKILSSDKELHVEIETNGSIDLLEFIKIDYPLAFTMDYKLPGSGMEAEMLISNMKYLTKNDTVKFVVGSVEDLDRAREIIEKHKLIGKCHIYISSVFGKIQLKYIVEYMIKNNMNGVSLQLQMHKFIWNPDQKGV